MDWLDRIEKFWPDLVAGFSLLAALFASLHAVLHKRDSRAATLWLGFIWFLPLLGSIFYLAMGVNRIRRHALAWACKKPSAAPSPKTWASRYTADAQHLKMLARIVGRVVAQPLTTGNAIQPLLNGDEAFPAMLAAIESAQRTISLSTYIFDNDPIGKQFVAALGARRQTRRRSARVD